MQRLWVWISALFFEPVSKADAGNGSEPKRLSRSGQVGLGLLIIAVAGFTYTYSWQLTGSLVGRWKLCLQLRAGSALQADYHQTLRMVDALGAATPSQKLRLKQQLRELVLRLDGVCSIVIFYRSQEWALLAVATISFSLLSYAVAIGLPQGLANVNNRTLQVAIGTNGFIGVIAVAFLQLGQQNENLKGNQLHYRSNHSLFMVFQTELANQQLTINRAQPLALDSPGAVAALIRGMDAQMRKVTVFSLGIDEAAALQMYARFGDVDSSGTPGRPVAPPAAAPPASDAAAP